MWVWDPALGLVDMLDGQAGATDGAMDMTIVLDDDIGCNRGLSEVEGRATGI